MRIVATPPSGGKKPTTPTIGTATDGGTGTTVSVAFTPSTYIGKSTITYTATSSPGSITGTGSGSPITVSGLTTGTAYTFTVTGNTNYGVASDASAASNSVTPASPSSYESIATTTLGANASTVTFSSIPSTYQHLQIRFMTRLSQTGTGFNDISFQVNGASSSYAWHRLSGDGASATAGALTADNGVYMYKAIPRDGNTSGIFGVGIIDILDYNSTSKNPTIRFIGGSDANGSGVAYLGSGMRTTAAATTSFTISGTGWNLVTGSTFALYGIKGS